MKKYFYSALAAGMLLACSQEQIVDVTDGESQMKVFKVEIPAVESRTVDDFEIGKGTQANTLIYAMYEHGSTATEPLISNVVTDDADGEDDGTFTVKVPMAKNITYDLLFLAYNEGNSAFILADDAKDTDLKKLEFKSTQTPNNDAFDAFVGSLENQGILDPNNVNLKRPFAQVNAATTAEDLENVKTLQTEVTTSNLVITKVPRYYDVLNGNVSEETLEKVTYSTTNIMKCVDSDQLQIITVDEKIYYYLTMAYVLAGKEETSIHNATFQFNAGEKLLSQLEIVSLPIQSNHRTNIVGDLLTNNKNYTIKIDARFGDDINKIGVIDGKIYIRVKNAEEFNAAFEQGKYDMIILENDIVLTETISRADANPTLTIPENEDLTIDLNGKKLSATSSETGKNYNLFDVRGTLTVKNGSMEYEHKGEDMGWNNFAEIFYVGFNGTLNLDGVTAKNLGGSAMAYVIDMVNATNITVNVKNSTLQSTYIPIRVFNNTTGVNNVTVKNSTLDGKYCFWVQYWLADGREQETLNKTLNLDIFNVEGVANNTFTFNNDNDAPILYGFNDAVYFDQYGNEIIQLEPIEGVEGVALDAEENYVITADAGLASISALIVADENNFAGKTILLDTDIDLANVEKMGDSFAPIGSTGERDDRNRLVCKPFKGTLDGQGHTIKNLKQSGWDMGYKWGQYGSLGLFAELEGATVKNVVLDGFDAQVEGGDISFIAGSATGECVFEDITIKSSSIGTYNNGCGGIIGWSGAGTYTFKNITIGEDVVLGGLWGSFDSSIGGIVGQAEPGATYNFENVTINCRIDAYNDCTASYDYYNYRMCGMIIGRCEETTTIDGSNYPDLSKYNFSFKDVVVNYGDWMNYHYCDPTSSELNGGRGMRVEPGYAYDGLPADYDHTQCTTHHNELIPFDQLIGGAQLGVKGLREVEGVTVNYPDSYNPEN